MYVYTHMNVCAYRGWSAGGDAGYKLYAKNSKYCLIVPGAAVTNTVRMFDTMMVGREGGQHR